MRLEDEIAALRSRGYVVRIDHHRCSRFEVEAALHRREQGFPLAQPSEYFPADYFKLAEPGNFRYGMSPWAGKTVATIATPKIEGEGFDVVAEGVAVCSPYDTYVRYTGAIKALGRAISNHQRGVKPDGS